MKRTFLLSCLIFLFCLSALSVVAQPFGDKPPPPDPETPVPLSGLEFLIAAGAALGVKKFLNKSRVQE